MLCVLFLSIEKKKILFIAFLCCHLFDNNSIQLTAEVRHTGWVVMILADNFPPSFQHVNQSQTFVRPCTHFFEESGCSIPPSSIPLRALSTIPMAFNQSRTLKPRMCKWYGRLQQPPQAVNHPCKGETLTVIYEGVFVLQEPGAVTSVFVPFPRLCWCTMNKFICGSQHLQMHNMRLHKLCLL